MPPHKRPQLAIHKQLGGSFDGPSPKRPRLTGFADTGVHSKQQSLIKMFEELAERFSGVRFCCGDWKRIMSPVRWSAFPAGIFLDPPYTERSGRKKGLYNQDSMTVGDEVHAWALENGDKKDLRIAVCGYEGEYDFPGTWSKFSWKTGGGYSNRETSRSKENAAKERIWFSPHCLKRHPGLFDEESP